MLDSTLRCESGSIFSDTQNLSTLDQQLVLLTQNGLPLVARPYHKIAEQLGVTATVVKSRLQSMLDDGRIRRIAAVPNHYKLGYTVNAMTVWDVDDQHVIDQGYKVGALDFVSHCYLRPRHLPTWPYNLFAMVHGKNRKDVDLQIDVIEKLLSKHCAQQQALFSVRILKKAGLRFSTNNCITQTSNTQHSIIPHCTQIME